MLACLHFKDLDDTAPPAVQNDATINSPPLSESLESTDHAPKTPQQLLVQGGESGSMSAFAGIVVFAAVVLFVLYLSKRRRTSNKADEKYGV